MKEFKYERKVMYYETDMMGIVHHSNYIKWFEEARCEYFDIKGIPYKTFEDNGILIPVLGVHCEYKSPSIYGDIVSIVVKYKDFSGVRMAVSYTVLNKVTGMLIATGETKHCFTDKNMKPISLKKANLKIYEKLMDILK